MLAEQAIQNGEFDKVSEIAEILTRFGNQKAEALLLVGRAKLKELSEPAYFLVNRTLRDPAYFLVGEIKRSLWSIFPTRETNKKTLKKQLSLKRLQKQYGENLHYIDKDTRYVCGLARSFSVFLRDYCTEDVPHTNKKKQLVGEGVPSIPPPPM